MLGRRRADILGTMRDCFFEPVASAYERRTITDAGPVRLASLPYGATRLGAPVGISGSEAGGGELRSSPHTKPKTKPRTLHARCDSGETHANE
jgi:hypothetical protein